MARKDKLGLSEPAPARTRQLVGVITRMNFAEIRNTAIASAIGFVAHTAQRRSTDAFNNYIDSKIDAGTSAITDYFRPRKRNRESSSSGSTATHSGTGSGSKMPKRMRTSKASGSAKKRRTSSGRSFTKLRRTYGKRKRSLGTGKRKLFGKRKRTFRKKKPNKATIRKAIIAAVAEPFTMVLNQVEKISAPASTNTTELCNPRVLFSFNTDNPYGRSDPSMLLDMRTCITGNPNRFTTEDYRIEHNIHNVNNIPVTIIGRKLRCRQNLPKVSPFDLKFIDLITRGYQVAGLLSPYAINDRAVSIYKSQTLVNNFKVVKTVKKTLAPGKQARWVHSSKGIRSHNLFDLFNLALGGTPALTDALAHWVQGETFWHFEAFVDMARGATNHVLQYPAFQLDMQTNHTLTGKLLTNTLPKVVRFAPVGFAAADAVSNIINLNVASSISTVVTA